MGSTSGSASVPRDSAVPDEDLDLIDLEQLAQSGDFGGGSWSSGSGEQLSLVEWCARTGGDTDSEDERTAHQIHALLDAILQQEKRSSSEKARLDSRTFVRPKRRGARPGLHALLNEETAPPTPPPGNRTDKFLTYNKYNAPFRLDTLLLDDKRKTDKAGCRAEGVERERQRGERERSAEGDASDAETHSLSRPIDIDLTQPANNLHATFTRGMSGVGASERNSLSMFQSDASFLNMSPPSLVSSILMDASVLSAADSTPSHNYGGVTSARESLDPHSMLNSMTLSIMEDKDMSTSFLSQSTCHEQDSLIGSLPPSMPSSVDSSYHTPAPPHPAPRLLSSLVDSTERLTMRPRADLFAVSPARRSDTFSKPQHNSMATRTSAACDDARQYESSVKRSPARYRDIMNETVNMTYNKNRLSTSPLHDKESSVPERNGILLKESPEPRVSALYRRGDAVTAVDARRAVDAVDMQRTVSLGRTGLQLPLDKIELSEIVQARHKLSLARSALPRDSAPPPTSLSTAQARRSDETPQRNATFRKHSPRAGQELEATMIYVKDNSSSDINSATVDLVDAANTTLQHEEEWGQRCAMVGSSDSADTATLSSSSPPETVHERNAHRQEMSLHQVASTPLGAVRKGGKDLLNLQHHISPIYGDRPVTAAAAINTATMVRRPNTAKPSPNKLSPNAGVGVGVAAMAVQRSSGLPTSKLRQYSSHKELSRIPGGGSGAAARAALGRGCIQRRNVYGSNPALSPTAPAPPAPLSLQRRDSYTISVDPQVAVGGRGEMRAPAAAAAAAVPALVRQGTETLRRPHSQLVLPREISGGGAAVSSVSQLRVRPAALTHRPVPAAEPQPRGSVLPRPSRLPAPRRSIRPPSVYSVAGGGSTTDTRRSGETCGGAVRPDHTARYIRQH